MEKLYLDIIDIAKTAGKAFKNERNFDISYKGDIANIVTSMDVKTQEIVISKLKEVLPEASYFAEENNVRELNDGYTFIIDPIDGTTNYAYDSKKSCISIALLFNKEVIFGTIYNPYLDECFYAIKNNGAYLNGQPIHVKEEPLSSSLIIFGSSPYNKELADRTFSILKNLYLNARDIRRSGSAAIDLCDIACGRGTGFFELVLSPWDFAAGSLIVKEAGGIIATTKGYAFGFDKPIPIIAGNKDNINSLLEIIEKDA